MKKCPSRYILCLHLSDTGKFILHDMKVSTFKINTIYRYIMWCINLALISIRGKQLIDFHSNNDCLDLSQILSYFHLMKVSISRMNKLQLIKLKKELSRQILFYFTFCFYNLALEIICMSSLDFKFSMSRSFNESCSYLFNRQ